MSHNALLLQDYETQVHQLSVHKIRAPNQNQSTPFRDKWDVDSGFNSEVFCGYQDWDALRLNENPSIKVNNLRFKATTAGG